MADLPPLTNEDQAFEAALDFFSISPADLVTEIEQNTNDNNQNVIDEVISELPSVETEQNTNENNQNVIDEVISELPSVVRLETDFSAHENAENEVSPGVENTHVEFEHQG
jgi:transketolase